jgi:hypothetical protein
VILNDGGDEAVEFREVECHFSIQSSFDPKRVHTNKKARQVVGGRFVHFKKSLDCRRSPVVPVMMMVTGGKHEEPV